jgi:hypothetical protein
VTEAAATRARRGPSAALVALAVGLGVVALALAVVYAARRQLAREAVTGWLASKGVASESQFQELGPGRLVGRIRIGPAQAPDLVVERAEVGYSLAGLMSGAGVQVTSIRLIHPVLSARVQDGHFSAGQLDPLITEFLARPPKPGEPHPRVVVDGGRLRLATDYGPLAADVSAVVADAKLVRLSARTAPARLARQGLAAEFGAADLQARAAGDRLEASLRAPFTALSTPQGRVRDGALTLAFAGAYPDLARTVVTEGALTAELRAAAAEAGGARTGPLALRAQAGDLRWTRSDRAVAGPVRVSADVRDLAAASLRLTVATADATGDVSLGRALRLRLAGRADARGGWSGLGAPTAEDSPEIAAVKGALAAFRASAEGASLELAGGKLSASVAGPLRLLPDRGGEVRLTRAGGGYRLTTSGGGLPRLAATARRVGLANGVFSADGAATAGLSIGPLQDADFDVAGALRIDHGVASVAASRCAGVKAARLELGQTPVEGFSARVCAAGAPLLRVGAGGWSLAGRTEAAAGRIPAWQARADQGAATFSMAQAHGRLSAHVQLASVRVEDAAPETRFRPFLASGQMQLSGDLWSGAFDARLPQGATLGHAILRHDGRTGAGALDVATGQLAFAAAGLQPQDLSPLARPLGTGVTGAAEFTGRVAWTKGGTTSGGRLLVRGLDFKSPAGQVSGLSGDVRFTSLAPLVAPPGQRLTAEKLAAALPLTGLSASLALSETALSIADGEATGGGGRLRLTHLEAPLAKDQPIQGELVLEAVQLHDLVEASPFADRVDLDARVSGHIPFVLQGGHVQVSGGELHAIAPGRLSIRREALTNVSAKGAIEAPGAAAAPPAAQTDTITDFAYQALENLAYDKLDAGVATRADGRLGVMFHIVGRHDPPKHQEITLSWMDVLRRRFLGKTLPLPSGTGVDLTLDTTLNLDELLKDYADFEQLRSSPPVQR